ncbi:MAG: hypothetical protein E6Q97_36870 [Desulfurellales bacterium]|nr:MAG: hypothetical protein E6Q97_36870 [Desulfurellales bacterium]
MPRRYSSEYKNLQPYVVEDARSVARAVLAGGAGGGSTSLPSHNILPDLTTGDAHPQYLTPARGDARYLVTAGNMITVTGTTVALANGTGAYQFIGTGAGTTAGWHNVSELAGNGLTHGTALDVGVSGLGLSVGADAVTLTSSSNPGAAASILASSAAGLLTLQNGAFLQAAQSNATFASGFAGSGWRVDYGITTAGKASAEFDDLTVRGRMRIYELLIQQIRATNGSVFVSSASKVVTTTAGPNPAWTVNGSQLTFNGSNATFATWIYTITTAKTDGATDTDGGSNDRRTYHGFLVGDIIRAQQVRWNGSAFAGVIQSDLEVTSVTNLYTYNGTFVSGDAPEVGYDYVRLGNAADTTRQGSVYITSDDSAAPFIDIVDGVYSHAVWNSADVKRVRVGKLTGITDWDFGGPLSGYGLYGNNVYLKGNIYATSGYFSGTLASSNGMIGGWALDVNLLHSGTDTNTVALDSGGINPAIYAGHATPTSAPFQVSRTGALTATNATIAGDFSVASSTFGTSGVQMQYNSNSPRFYVGDGSSAFLKYETATGYPIASGIYIQGASYVTGSVYAGGGAIRLSTNGQSLTLPTDTSPNIPTSTSGIRWRADVTANSWSNTTSYAGVIAYKNTSVNPDVMDLTLTSVVGDDDDATFDARVVLQAGHYASGVYTDANLIITRERGTGARTVNANCDTFSAEADIYAGDNISGASITDRTPHYDGDAIAELRGVRGNGRGGIDHSSLPAFARKTVKRRGNQEEEGRDLGAMISILTVAVQQLDARLDTLERRRNGN